MVLRHHIVCELWCCGQLSAFYTSYFYIRITCRIHLIKYFPNPFHSNTLSKGMPELFWSQHVLLLEHGVQDLPPLWSKPIHQLMRYVACIIYVYIFILCLRWLQFYSQWCTKANNALVDVIETFFSGPSIIEFHPLQPGPDITTKSIHYKATPI